MTEWSFPIPIDQEWAEIAGSEHWTDGSQVFRMTTSFSTSKTHTQSKAYLVGGGIASLATAAYLIKDGNIPGENIKIFEELAQLGGSLDGQGSPQAGYVIRGGRMLNTPAYTCTYDLLAFIPSLSNFGKTVLDEIIEFNQINKTYARSRLVKDGKHVDVSSMGLNNRNRWDLIRLMLRSEDSLEDQQIDEYFSPDLFETPFWFMWATMFAFQPWHSLIEFKRYIHRFIHEFPRINTLAGVDRTPYNQYDSIVLPLTRWLEKQGVRFQMNCNVTHLEFSLSDASKSVQRIHYVKDEQPGEVPVRGDDYVFVTLGSMTASSTLGSMTAPPTLDIQKPADWLLWEQIATVHPDFGRPVVFDSRIEESKWISFTMAFREPAFFDLMEKFTGNTAGTGGLVTFIDSPWLMSVVLAHQPHFLNQPDHVQVGWGYGLFSDREGQFVRKKMAECTGEEILTEICSFLRFEEAMPSILETSTCIPCMMPYITSQFLTRKQGDRPSVVPPGASNFAFIGQFCEIPDDVVFTVEYSVRSAQIAVYTLLGLTKDVSPLYKGEYDLKVLWNAGKALFS